MTDIVRQRLQSALKDKGLAATRVSVEAGLNRSFLSDFFQQKTRSVSTDNLQKLAAVLGVSVGWLTGESDSHAPRTENPKPISSAHATADETRDIPVFGTAAGSVQGAIAISGEVIDWLRRPPGLRGARDAYALYVTGVSMEPKYATGDIIFIHPHRPLRAGDIAVIQTIEGGEVQSWLKQFVRQTESEVLAKQFNPPDDLKFDRSKVQAIHRVMTMNELLGV